MSKNGKRILAIIIVLLLGSQFSYGIYRSYQGGNASPPVSSNQLVPSQKQTQPLDFTLPDLKGGTITLSQYQGKKPVILDFFATWCPNCRRAMPSLNRYYQTYKDEVEVIGINMQERKQLVEDFISSRDISYPIALDPLQQASRLFGIRYTNTHILIDKAGNFVREIPGDIRESDIQALIKLSL
ncbi:TlpA family protein disulfide reductase [Patescibacteria group bacterium]|nr:TlpA family protein disulfide reductase [Patescibacteria group bacterium]